jgi:hypothetical protein
VTRPQQPLPTPPNSISPSLPPHSLRAQLKSAAAVVGDLDPIDSDLDLRDVVILDLNQAEREKVITPSVLATYYLPAVLLAHGPLAVRYIMNYLASAVPGFIDIPAAKARRMVTAALEGKGGSGSAGGCGGMNGDVDFEKVGWGRWTASRRGAQGRGPADRNRHSPVSDSSGYLSSGARGDSAAAFSHDGRDTTSMLDTEMSLDEDSAAGSASCSEAPDDNDDVVMGDDPDDATDEEDWGAMGAAALRASGACATTTRAGMARPPHQRPNFFRPVYNDQRAPARAPAAGGRSASAHPGRPLNIDFSALGGGSSDAQEREAVEALLSLGTV